MPRTIDLIRAKYYQPEIYGKDRSNALYHAIMDENDPAKARSAAYRIPIYATLELSTKMLTGFCRTIDAAQQSLVDRELAIGNIQTLGVDVFEYMRTTLGVIASIPVAYLASPQSAAKAFLIPDAEDMEPHLTPNEGTDLYAMGFKLHHFFETQGIDYRICSGTALGAYREEGIIKNDDDIDLMIHPDHVDKFESLVKNGIFKRETGLSIAFQSISGGYECFFNDSQRGKKGTPTEKIGKPFIDIFPGFRRTVAGEEVITYRENKMFYQSKGDYFTDEEWGESPQPYVFGPLFLNGIEHKPMQQYLQRCYGSIALEYKTRLYPHEVYSQGYAAPYQIPYLISQHPKPTYMKHTDPSPFPHNDDLFHLRSHEKLITIYVDGIYDLFHDGHRNYIETAIQAARRHHPSAKVYVIAGVCGDEASKDYKREPIMTMEERADSVEKYLKGMCHNNPFLGFHILRDAPIAVTPEVINDHGIDIVFHGDDFDASKLDAYYGAVINHCEFSTVPYTAGVSTTELLCHFFKHGDKASYNNETVLTHPEIAERIRCRKPEEMKIADRLKM